MPAIGGPVSAIAFQVGSLFSGSERGSLIGINAEIDYDKLFANAPLQVLQTFNHAIKDHGAKHRTFVVTRNKDDWPIFKIIPKLNRVSLFIPKGQTQRNLRAELLLETDAGQHLVG